MGVLKDAWKKYKERSTRRSITVDASFFMVMAGMTAATGGAALPHCLIFSAGYIWGGCIENKAAAGKLVNSLVEPPLQEKKSPGAVPPTP